MAKKITGRLTDKMRLDWLTRKAWGVAFTCGVAHVPSGRKVGKWRCEVGKDEDGYGETPRRAIDSAMKASRRGEK